MLDVPQWWDSSEGARILGKSGTLGKEWEDQRSPLVNPSEAGQVGLQKRESVVEAGGVHESAETLEDCLGFGR